MTVKAKNEDSDGQVGRPSSLPFDPADLVAIRLLPAEYARLLEVSKTAVSNWTRDGKITLGPDGRLDPKVATRQLIQRTDPARLRARVLRQAVADHDGLRKRIAELEQALDDECERGERRESAARAGERDDNAYKLMVFMHAIGERFAEARQAQEAGTLLDWLDELAAVSFYGHNETG